MNFETIYDAIDFLQAVHFTICENPYKWEVFAEDENGVEECLRFSSDDELIEFASERKERLTRVDEHHIQTTERRWV